MCCLISCFLAPYFALVTYKILCVKKMTENPPVEDIAPTAALYDYQSHTSQYTIETLALHKTYQMGNVQVHAVRGVDLKIKRGEFITILGVSGSGKSTLLHLLGALDQPTEGKVFIEGLDLSTLDNGKLAEVRLHRIGFVFQFFNLMPQLTAQSNVELPLKLSEVPTNQARNRASQLLAKVGLGERTDHIPSELSGGEQQRVAIARALANNPRIILADEPTGNLDTKTGAEIISLLRNLNKTQNLTIVVVGHDQRLMTVADRVFEMEDGVFVSEHAGGGEMSIS
jgi:putative ABC transport system ATP-binding protein